MNIEEVTEEMKVDIHISLRVKHLLNLPDFNQNWEVLNFTNTPQCQN
jgi:hypothetical protein